MIIDLAVFMILLVLFQVAVSLGWLACSLVMVLFSSVARLSERTASQAA